MGEFLDKLSVKVDSEEVSGLKYSVNKDDQLVISFDEMTIEMNKSALFVISASFADFDDYGEVVAYYLGAESDINATEKKTGARLTVDGTALVKANAIPHAFNGGKIRLSNNKLGNLDGVQGAEGLLVAEGTITVSEPISYVSFDVNVTEDGDYVTALRMFVNGEEYEAKKNGRTFSFSKVEIEKSGKIQFKMDIDDSDSVTGTIELTPNFNKASFDGAKYDNSRKEVENEKDVSGSISFSKVTIQPANATFKNKTTTAVEFMEDDTTDDAVVFNGTYTAKKSDLKLNKFYVVAGDAFPASVNVTYDLYINDELVASTDVYGAENYEPFDDVEVKAGESVNVVVKATAEVYDITSADLKTYSGYKIGLGGLDQFDKDITDKEAKVVNMKLVSEGSVSLTAGSAVSKTVLYKGDSNKTLAQFTIKPAEGSSSVEINTISFNLVAAEGSEAITSDDVNVTF
ncbi:hypothetical protein J6V86_03235 [bacterium]|nr:hypothetical protein [bacterium]